MKLFKKLTIVFDTIGMVRQRYGILAAGFYGLVLLFASLFLLAKLMQAFLPFTYIAV